MKQRIIGTMHNLKTHFRALANLNSLFSLAAVTTNGFSFLELSADVDLLLCTPFSLFCELFIFGGL
jgi:hypothetical protein